MATALKEIPHVLVLIAGTHASHLKILRGVLHFIQLHSPWALDVRMGREGEPTSFDFENWKVSGIIANDMPPPLAEAALARGTPVIVINDIWREGKPIARISCDNRAIAHTAATHLVGAGFRSFAFVGEASGLWWSRERGKAFVEDISGRGFPCAVYGGGKVGSATGDGMSALVEWIRSLPDKTAVFAAYDIGARKVLDACSAAGRQVPEEIAILGVDDDDIICETASPPLSSIPMSTEDTGFRAAELLDKAMRGEVALHGSTVDLFYTGVGVTERRSTDVHIVSDSIVRRCRELMEANIGSGLQVIDLARSLHVSRRTLEMRFRSAVGHSLNEEIIAIRLRRAKALLSKTKKTQAEIAQLCGFCDACYMSSVFKRRCGAPPSAFR
jgi:LacI family transcriptional regulator